MGAGKSTVADYFAGHGVTVVDTDVISRELTSQGGAAMAAIINTFGAGYVDEGGALNRPAMRSHVFSDSAARRQLEMILHPLIRAAATQRLLQAISPYVLLVVPLLSEHFADYRDFVDRILVVDCEETQQLRRIMARPSMNEAQARAILASQSSREARLTIADDVIDNSGDLAELAKQVSILHTQYLYAAQGKSATTYNN
jgi:dephospho-CoA kinase